MRLRRASAPCVCAVRLRRASALETYVWIFITFGTFIGACAISQLMGIVTFWWALYRLATVVKVVCAVASAGTTVYLLRMTPRLARSIVQSLDMLTIEQHEKDLVERRLRDSQAKLGFALVASKGIGTWEWDLASDLFRSDANMRTSMASTRRGQQLACPSRSTCSGSVRRMFPG